MSPANNHEPAEHYEDKAEKYRPEDAASGECESWWRRWNRALRRFLEGHPGALAVTIGRRWRDGTWFGERRGDLATWGGAAGLSDVLEWSNNAMAQ